MEQTSNHNEEMIFQTTLSFQPLIRAWESIINDGREGFGNLYQHLIDQLNEHPELLGLITDLSVLQQNQSLIEQLMATIFPITLSDYENLFAVNIPFTYHTIYSSQLFRAQFLNETGDFINVPDGDTGKRLHAEKRAAAFQLILRKFYGVQVSGQLTSVHLYPCPKTNLDKYMELEVDGRFIDVTANIELPPIPQECAHNYYNINDLVQNPGLMDWIPLNGFNFEGIAIVHIREVTEREVINNIKTGLLTLQSFSDVRTFRRLQDQIQNLVGIPGVKIGVTPFFHVNDHLVFSELHNANSILLKNLSNNEKRIELSQALQQLFKASNELLVISEINDENLLKYTFLENLKKQGWQGVIICPLRYNDRLIGILEIVTEREGKLDKSVVFKIEPAIPLFELALQKSAENLDSQIDKVIKEQFTAVQSSVEWRFTEAALNYLSKIQKEEDAKIESISFSNVYPLYGAIDIRNSSTERNRAIQQDMLEQLEMAGKIVRKAKKETYYPLLEEIDYKIKKYTHSVSNIVLSDEEVSINHFLKQEIVQLFQHLNSILPSLQADISEYFASINSVVDMLYHHRKDYDDSITFINKAVARFIDKEQQLAQQIYPHYFERFVTDGVDFNIYIGQSIRPNLPFNDFYLKNLKIWQLTTLAKAAILTRKLENDLPIPLQTTQLILAHSHPISISFRPAERKFDVDGAYNIRYEIVKKRIDKVRIKDSNERLTQPGKIAIVFSQPTEGKEYQEYIEYLQNQEVLTGEIEKYDLEELQGVSGLKALRIAINLDAENVEGKKEKKSVAKV